jgi:hypothetical protein
LSHYSEGHPERERKEKAVERLKDAKGLSKSNRRDEVQIARTDRPGVRGVGRAGDQDLPQAGKDKRQEVIRTVRDGSKDSRRC